MTQERWSSFGGDSSGGGSGGFVDKDDWAEREVPFIITHIAERNGRFGQEWLISVKSPDEESDTLSFKRGTGGRDDALEAAQSGLHSGRVTTIGPVILSKIRTKSGNPFFTLAEAPGGASQEVVGSLLDDLPFDDTDDLPF